MADTSQPPNETHGEQICSRMESFNGKLKSGEPIHSRTLIRGDDGEITEVPCTILARNPDSQLADALPPHGVTYRLTATDNHLHTQGVAERSVGPDAVKDEGERKKTAIDLIEAATKDLSKTD